MKNKLERPLFVEFSGTPRAGKTTVIEALADYFKRSGFKIKILKEESRNIQNISKRHPDFSLYAANRILSRLLSLSNSNYDIILIDRGVFDSLSWLEYYKSLHNLKQQDLNHIKEYYSFYKWFDLIDLVFVFKVGVNTALEREKNTSLTSKRGRIVNKESLGLYNVVLEKTIKKQSENFNIHKFNSSFNKYSKNTNKMIDIILNELDSISNPEVLCIPKSIMKNFNITEGITFDKTKIIKFINYYNQHGIFLKRDFIEKNSDYIQPIPSVVIKNNNKVLTYFRNSPKSVLHNSSLIWVGGHITRADLKNSGDFNEGVITRQLFKKLYLRTSFKLKPYALTYSINKFSKSDKHIGVVYQLSLNSKYFKLLNQTSIHETKNKYLTLNFRGIDYLYRNAPVYDSWSQQLINSFMHH